MKNKIVYVVVSGEYSDFGINAMFSSKKSAEHYISEMLKAKSYEQYDIQEWSLDQHFDCRNVLFYRSHINLNTGQINWRDEVWELTTELGNRIQEVNVFDGAGYQSQWKLVANSTVSVEHADKLAIEARQKWLREKGTKMHGS